MLKNNSQNCQKVISAKVYSCDNKNNVTLLIDAGCESCTSSCIMSTASKKITLYTEKKYNTGDTVSLIIDEKYMLKISMLLFGLPLIIMFAVSAIIDAGDKLCREPITFKDEYSCIVISEHFLYCL